MVREGGRGLRVAVHAVGGSGLGGPVGAGRESARGWRWRAYVRRMVGIVAIAVALGTATACEGLELPGRAAGAPGGPSATGNAPAAKVPAADVAAARRPARQAAGRRPEGRRVPADPRLRPGLVGRREPQRLRHPGRHPAPRPDEGAAARAVHGGRRRARRPVHRPQTVTFTKSDAAEVQIDHVVPLGAAWSRGARDWPQAAAGAVRERPGQPAGDLGVGQREQERPRAGASGCRGRRTAARTRSSGSGCPHATSSSLTPPDKASLTTLLARC